MSYSAYTFQQVFSVYLREMMGECREVCFAGVPCVIPVLWLKEDLLFSVLSNWPLSRTVTLLFEKSHGTEVLIINSQNLRKYSVYTR